MRGKAIEASRFLPVASIQCAQTPNSDYSLPVDRMSYESEIRPYAVLRFSLTSRRYSSQALSIHTITVLALGTVQYQTRYIKATGGNEFA